MADPGQSSAAPVASRILWMTDRDPMPPQHDVPMTIRSIHPNELDAWLRMRTRLWPDSPRELLASEQAPILADTRRNVVLVACDAAGAPIGFVEVSLRECAEGCESSPVGYIEAWYVEPEHRGRGLGCGLLEAAEAWAAGQGCREMASDTELWNEASVAAHRAHGYREVARVVLMAKVITPREDRGR